jgi:hypothetical protein
MPKILRDTQKDCGKPGEHLKSHPGARPAADQLDLMGGSIFQGATK